MTYLGQTTKFGNAVSGPNMLQVASQLGTDLRCMLGRLLRGAHARRLARGVSGAAAAGLAWQCSTARSESAPPRPAAEEEGGVLPEYRKKGLSPRAITPISPPRKGFFSKEVIALGVPIRAHDQVSDGALAVAADRLSRMLRYLPAPVRERLVRRGATFHIIGVGQGTSDLPEHSHMKGVDGGYTGERGVTLDMRARGMGGVHSSCGEENLIDLDTDPRYAGRDILTHEFAHCVMDVGLPRAVQEEIRETHRRSVEVEGRWRRADGEGLAYAGSNASEYFAELTMWFFGTHGEFADRERRLPSPGPGGLAAYDPDGFALLSAIYGGTHPALATPDPTPERLAPADDAPAGASERAGDGHREAALREETLVSVEFDNRGCGCSWRLSWLDADGKRVAYGSVEDSATRVQQTYPGHVWLLEASAAAASRRKVLRYEAADGADQLVDLAHDAGCVRAADAGGVAGAG